MDVANEALQSILTRRSIRRYVAKPVEEDKIVDSRSRYGRTVSPEPPALGIHSAHQERGVGRAGQLQPSREDAKGCALAIVVCGEPITDRFAGLVVIDCSAAVQNALLAAHALGLGAVWLGVHPRRDRQEALRTSSSCRPISSLTA